MGLMLCQGMQQPTAPADNAAMCSSAQPRLKSSPAALCQTALSGPRSALQSANPGCTASGLASSPAGLCAAAPGPAPPGSSPQSRRLAAGVRSAGQYHGWRAPGRACPPTSGTVQLVSPPPSCRLTHAVEQPARPRAEQLPGASLPPAVESFQLVQQQPSRSGKARSVSTGADSTHHTSLPAEQDSGCSPAPGPHRLHGRDVPGTAMLPA